MNYLLFITICAICLAGCESRTPLSNESSSCNIDASFALEYTNCLLILAQARHGFFIDFENRMRAVECLEAITGQKSRIIKFSDSPYLLYKEEGEHSDAFAQDILQWTIWYNNNRCNYLMKDAKLAFARSSEKLGIELTWPSFYYENIDVHSGVIK